MQGIDISSYQSGIDISKLTTVDFVIIKATEGINYVSPTLKKQTEDTIKANKYIGFYHYCTGTSPLKEAEAFITAIKNVIPNDNTHYILALDYEVYGNTMHNAGIESELNYINELAKEVYKKSGVRPFINVCYSDALRLNIDPNVLWCSAYYGEYLQTDNFKGNIPCIIRQYSGSGEITGYNKRIDLDYISDSDAELLWNTILPLPIPEYTNADILETIILSHKSLSDVLDIMTEYVILTQCDASDEELAKKVWDGKYGIKEQRKNILGDRYKSVQELVDRGY